jgi:alkylation response protein AidB-like acyl-CoA dehydrogenase
LHAKAKAEAGYRFYTLYDASGTTQSIARALAMARASQSRARRRIFDLMGARATSARYGFDRFWRNVRGHTLHDPVACKAREVGTFALNGRTRLAARTF